jgi:hypothetical protein
MRVDSLLDAGFPLFIAELVQTTLDVVIRLWF